jgi:hypothetical protein
VDHGNWLRIEVPSFEQFSDQGHDTGQWTLLTLGTSWGGKSTFVTIPVPSLALRGPWGPRGGNARSDQLATSLKSLIVLSTPWWSTSTTRSTSGLGILGGMAVVPCDFVAGPPGLRPVDPGPPHLRQVPFATFPMLPSAPVPPSMSLLAQNHTDKCATSGTAERWHKWATTMSSWSAPTTNEEAARRAGGRRSYNCRRQLDAFVRRVEVERAWWQMVDTEGLMTRGIQARLAERFNVSRSTICRDVAFMQEGWALLVCPTCDTDIRLREWRRLALTGRVKLTPSEEQ